MHTVVFGDSIAKGIVTMNGKLETIENNAVKLISDFYHQTIDNVSFYGQTLKRIFDKNIIDQYLGSLEHREELYVVFALGGNDSDYDWNKVSQNPHIHHDPKTPIRAFEEMLIQMIKQLQSKGISVILTTIIPLDSQLYFDQVISKMGDPEQIMIFLNQDVENIARQQKEYSSAIMRCAEETQSLLIDVRSKMELNAETLKYMCKDGVHPNENGYKFLADSIIELINQNDSFEKWRNVNQLSNKQSLIARVD
ncbi:MAG: SGNH/GDSL hydrolase family protein [Firmicutes bacterium]|nr:SGNH/GDSL hydrolase family protein [Bacillota bacterium]